LSDVFMGNEQESPSATSGVDDGVDGARIDDIDDRPYEVTRGEVLARTRTLVRGTLGEQSS
jgi:hypothetical protein